MKCRFTKLSLIILLLLSCRSLAQKAYGQGYSNLFFKQFSASNQLPTMSCTDLYKDNYGFLWIGTAYGICIYNGSEFTNISLYSDKKDFYIGDSPHNFLQLDSNRLLISCTNGFFIFYYDTRKISPLHIPLKKTAEERIEIIGFNKKHDRVIAKVGSYIYSFDLALKQKTIYNCVNESKDVYVRNELTAPYCFYFTKGGHLVKVDIEHDQTDSLIYMPGEKSIVINGQSAGQIIIATSSSITEYTAASGKVIYKTPIPVQVGMGTAFYPRSLKKALDGNFWLGGETNFFLFNITEKKINTVDGSLSDFSAKKVNSFTIADIWVDKESLFMTSYNGGGMFEYKSGLNNFRDYYLKNNMDAGTFSMIVKDGYILGANNVNGLYKFPLNTNGSPFTYYPVSQTSGPILQLEDLDNDRIWVLFNEDFKIGIIDLKTLTLTNEKLDINNSLKKYFDSINNFRLLSRDFRPLVKKAPNGFSYITVGRKLYRIDKGLDKKFQFNYIDSIVSTASVCALYAGDKIILGSTKGEIFALENNKLVKKTNALNDFFIPVKSLDLDSKGNIYLMTVNGIYIYDTSYTLTKTLLKPAFGLLENTVASGKMDQYDVLWMCTKGGVTSYNTITKQLINYRSAGLMRNNYFITKAVVSDADHIYFGGSEGITQIDTKQQQPTLLQSKLYFSEIRNGDSVIHNSLIPKPIEEYEPFSYGDNSFSFSFNSISYKQSDGVYYKYKLQGFDTAWNFIDKDKHLNFLSLPPGSYKLIIKEINPDNNAGAELYYSFVIKKPFWKTASFLILSALLLMAFISLVITAIFRRKLEAQRIENSRELALKTERERISQDLHDDLGSGLTSIRLLTKTIIAKQGPTPPGSPLHSIGKISGELIDQMSEIIWLLSHIDDTINQLLAHLRIYMAEYLQRTESDIKLSFANNITDDFSINGIQRRNILLVIKEVFHNVVKHSNANGFFIECHATEDSIIIMMKDNGIGLPENINPNRNGLNNIKKRVAAISGKITFKTNYGTLITIEIPKKMTT